jgi:hypothetical protein
MAAAFDQANKSMSDDIQRITASIPTVGSANQRICHGESCLEATTERASFDVYSARRTRRRRMKPYKINDFNTLKPPHTAQLKSRNQIGFHLAQSATDAAAIGSSTSS